MDLKRAASIATATAMCIALVGCAGQTVSPSSAATPAPATTPTPASSPSVNCTAALVLTQVRQLLAGQDFEAHYLTIGDKFTLSVWLVDPEIDPVTPQSGMAAAGRQATARGLSISYQIVDQIPCTQRVFDQVNPMIVDGRFQHWYKDFLPIGAFVGLHDPTTDELIAAVEATGTAPEEPRATAPQVAETRTASSCGWPEARAAIHAYLGAEGNSAAYLIIGAGLLEYGNPTPNTPDDVGVEVQWPALDTREAADPVVLERLGHVAEALACLWPAIDSLEAFVVDPAGRTLVYAVVPGSIIRARLIPLPSGGVRLYHMPLPMQP
jgi:hypothetical protein